MQQDFVLFTDTFWLLMQEELLGFGSGLSALKLTFSVRKFPWELRSVYTVLK